MAKWPPPEAFIYGDVIELKSPEPLSNLVQLADKHNLKITDIQISFMVDGWENRLGYHIRGTATNQEILRELLTFFQQNIVPSTDDPVKRKEQYNLIYAKLKAGDIEIRNLTVIGAQVEVESLIKELAPITKSILSQEMLKKNQNRVPVTQQEVNMQIPQ